MQINRSTELPGSCGVVVLHGFPTDTRITGQPSNGLNITNTYVKDGRVSTNNPTFRAGSVSPAYMATLNTATQKKAIAHLKGLGFKGLKPFRNTTGNSLQLLIWRPNQQA